MYTVCIYLYIYLYIYIYTSYTYNISYIHVCIVYVYIYIYILYYDDFNLAQWLNGYLMWEYDGDMIIYQRTPRT